LFLTIGIISDCSYQEQTIVVFISLEKDLRGLLIDKIFEAGKCSAAWNPIGANIIEAFHCKIDRQLSSLIKSAPIKVFEEKSAHSKMALISPLQ
jgi:hypothetical protein